MRDEISTYIDSGEAEAMSEKSWYSGWRGGFIVGFIFATLLAIYMTRG